MKSSLTIRYSISALILIAASALSGCANNPPQNYAQSNGYSTPYPNNQNNQNNASNYGYIE